MKLNDLDIKNSAVKALRENFSVSVDVSRLDRPNTLNMLKKVSRLIKEARLSPDFHKSEINPSYMKMLFMEQALTDHLRIAKQPRIVFENEEVEKSQVILAAQDMVDNVQKWYEEVNDMMVKELPALVDSIESEIGVNESTSFNETVSSTLQSLTAALQEAQTALKSAVGGLTGQGGADAFAPEEPGEEDMDMDMDMDMEEPEEEPVDLPPPPGMGDEEEEEFANVGRAKR